ncbi:P450 monooxygenase [Colletotrichum higginsianum]|nr:P450 monooxygenase [Colletotrichum higginsianum]
MESVSVDCLLLAKTLGHCQLVGSFAVLLTLLFGVYHFLRGPLLYPGFPAVGLDDKSWGWFRYRNAVREYRTRGKQIVNEGSEVSEFGHPKLHDAVPVDLTNILCLCLYPKTRKPFQVVTDTVTKICFPPEYANELKNIKALSFTKALEKVVFLSVELGVAGFVDDNTCGYCNWQEAAFKPIGQNLVARLSARLFVGTQLCRNQEWLKVSTAYAVDGFVAAYALRGWHPLVRWAWLLEAFDKAGITGRWNVADAQLGLSIVAIHTTTELLTGALFDIVAAGPHLVDELREEIVRVLGPETVAQSQGNTVFSKTSLYEMKLLDSTLKESQRMHTRGIGAMGRVSEADVQLSDGSTIPKGAFSIVTLGCYHDEKVYPQPGIFNPRRFLEMRSKPGEEKNWQLVTTSPHHLGFGYGDHACPGRFLAANEVKIALVYLLMEYDWKLPGQRPQDTMVIGSQHQADARAKVLFKKRVSEIAL